MEKPNYTTTYGSIKAALLGDPYYASRLLKWIEAAEKETRGKQRSLTITVRLA